MAVMARRWCRRCGVPTEHEGPLLGLGWDCLLTAATGGLFLPVWLVLVVQRAVLPNWWCLACGTKGGTIYPPRPKAVIIPGGSVFALMANRLRGIDLLALHADLTAEIREILILSWSECRAIHDRLPAWGQPIIWGLIIPWPLVWLVFVLLALRRYLS
jgi:hypothetical protein